MIRILLCDDESIQRAALRVLLQRLTDLPLQIAEILEAAHGQAAVEIVQTCRPEIVFLDLRMPVMGGMAAALEIGRLAPETQVIILTAYDEFNFAQEAIQIGVADYLLKPASSADLKRVLSKAMAVISAQADEQRQLAALRQRVELARPLILQEYVNDLLTGGAVISEAALAEKQEFLALAGHPEQVLVLKLTSFDQATTAQTETERQLLKERILLLAKREATGQAVLLHRLGHDRITLLLFGPGAPAEQERDRLVIALAERIRLAVNRELGLPLIIGIGRAVNSPLKLHQSLADALQAASSEAAHGNNYVLHWRDMDQGAASQVLPEEEEAVLQGMRLGNRSQLTGQLGALLALLLQQEAGRLDSLRWRLLELLVLLTRAAILGGANAEQATTANVHQLAQIMACDSPSGLCQIVSQAAADLLRLVLAERGLRHQRLMRQAVGYLEQHSHEQLSLEAVARVVHLSPFYFSHIFKEQTGITFVQYLTELRLAAAKQLLRQTELSIGQIAERVGYQDVNYFSRVFKKSVGATPSAYRQRLADQGQKQ